MKVDDLRDRFDRNVKRAENLVVVYEQHIQGTGGGRRPISSTDVLRAAVVFLHATLEDLLRETARAALPAASADALNDVPLVGRPTQSRAQKFFLGELAAHRGKTVYQVISESVNAYLDRGTFNNTTEVSGVLEVADVEVEKVQRWLAEIQKLMDRRHNIVHRADENLGRGKGQHAVLGINPKAARVWVDAVRDFGSAVLDELGA